MKLFLALLRVYLILRIFFFSSEEIRASLIEEQRGKTIKIGLLIPDDKSTAAFQGADLAIRKANKKGGFNGRLFQLVVRSMEGPWGTGSKQTVNLIFDEEVWAIMGSHDGRNAHLAEQVAAKARVVLLSAWSADPTLSQAFVPWFFNCVPNDSQQAAALAEEIYAKGKINRVAVIYDNDYDSKSSLQNFLKKTRLAGEPDPALIIYENSGADCVEIIDRLNKARANCIVLFGHPDLSLKIIQLLRLNKMNQPVFGSVSLMDENKVTELQMQEYNNILSIPSGSWPKSKNDEFRQEFQRIYNKMPGTVASFAFDGMTILIEAIKNAGSPDREKIQKSIESTHYIGVTGKIQFDDHGNRSGPFKVTGIKNGMPLNAE